MGPGESLDRLSLVAKSNKLIGTRMICRLQLSGPIGELIIDGSLFEYYIREILCPQLTEGQTAVMDSLSSHHRESIREPIKAKGLGA